MSITIELADFWDDCPAHWQNMITHLRNKNNLQEGGHLRDRIIKRELKRFNAVYHSRQTYIEFMTDEGYTAFLLTYQ